MIANHPNHSDPAFLLGNSPRVLHFLHAREYFDVFLLRCIFRRIGSIPVRRDGHDVRGVRRGLEDLKRGQVLCIFPEGEITLPKQVTGRRPKAGAALLALRSHAPVIPAYIEGGPQRHDLLSDWLWPSSGVRVRFGEAIDLSADYDRPIDHDLLDEVTALFMERIYALCQVAENRGYQATD